MQWLERLDELEKCIVHTVPNQGRVKHARGKNNGDMLVAIDRSCSVAESKAESLLASLYSEADISVHPYIDCIQQNLY